MPGAPTKGVTGFGANAVEMSVKLEADNVTGELKPLIEDTHKSTVVVVPTSIVMLLGNADRE